ncbi:LysR family transcriptional regulator [Prauserella sp. PE36]|uniref:LysR family transcriptional regulator n=1 Tax=Prauserella endophytica TaxID=1592324 RepID=A0ABY2SB50_9PSEU|nr:MULTISPECIES: LysR family transcriptional regulator [Prauserella]PXY35233.1 LysR family transcriptional regulator [Prauserella coralliicola]RBM13115.1 LysR family transcriptional regulator [Prauserella sp. PE36]TKG73130.1 LysR family transcriptional regulator [Prauserella endophytica]
MIDLRRLSVLRAVAHYGTVTAAAHALHLTPSAASQQIRQLGRELGVALLEPNGRRVRLTGAALGLLSHADAIEARWRQAESELHATGAEPSGVLRMAGFPTAMCRFLGPLTVRLRERYPALTVRLRESETPRCFDLLFNGDVDLAVVEAIPGNPAAGDQRFDQRPLLDDPFDLLLPGDHPLAGRRCVELSEVAGEPWIIGADGDAWRAHVLAACSAAGFSPNIAHEACDASLVASLVDLGLGVALFPRLAQFQPDVDVRRVEVSGTAPSRRFLTCTRRGGRDAPAVAAALELLHEVTAR